MKSDIIKFIKTRYKWKLVDSLNIKLEKITGTSLAIMKILFLITIFVVLAESKLEDYTFVNPLKDRKLLGDFSFLVQSIGIVASRCVIDCAANTKCRSVNYHGESQTCMLLEQSSSNDGQHLIVEAKGWTYYEKTKVRTIILMIFKHYPLFLLYDWRSFVRSFVFFRPINHSVLNAFLLGRLINPFFRLINQ